MLAEIFFKLDERFEGILSSSSAMIVEPIVDQIR